MKIIKYELQTLRQGNWEKSNYDYEYNSLYDMIKFVRKNGGYRVVKTTETLKREVIILNKRKVKQ